MADLAINNCFSCRENGRFDSLPLREKIVADRHWRVAHSFNTALPGWLVLIPRRHLTAIADLTDVEAVNLGVWQVELSSALRTVTGCPKTYVVQFAEAEGFSHVHFHVIPRPGDLPDDRRGPDIFRYLAAPEDQRVPVDQMDALAVDLRVHLQSVEARLTN